MEDVPGGPLPSVHDPDPRPASTQGHAPPGRADLRLMPELDLPPGPRELFAAVRKPLAQAPNVDPRSSPPADSPMIDYNLVRIYYHHPPPSHPERLPSDEELLARYERRRYDDCILRGGDPRAEGLGPHGSMIGGPGKPTTVFHTHPTRTTLLDPLPLAWWDYPRAKLRILPPGGHPAAHAYLAGLAGAHLAGVLNRPSGARLDLPIPPTQLLRSPHPPDSDIDILRHLFGAIAAPCDQFHLRPSRRRMIQAAPSGPEPGGDLTLRDGTPRALHATRIRRPDLVRWINRFARPPVRHAGPRGGRTRTCARSPPGSRAGPSSRRAPSRSPERKVRPSGCGPTSVPRAQNGRGATNSTVRASHAVG